MLSPMTQLHPARFARIRLASLAPARFARTRLASLAPLFVMPPPVLFPYIKKCVHTLKRIYTAFTCVVRQIGTITGHEVARVKKVFFFNLRFF